MKSLAMKNIFIFFVSCLIGSNSFSQDNLVQNGGFENGEANWLLLGGDNISYTIDNSSTVEGVNSLKGEINQLGENPWSIQIKNAFGPVEEGKVYRASIWIKSATEGSTVNFTIGKNTANYDEYASVYGMSVTTEWTKYILEFVAQVSTEDDIALAMHITNVDTYWFDDFRVIELTDEVTDATINATGDRVVLAFKMNLEAPDENDQLPFFVYSPAYDYTVSRVSLSNQATELHLHLAELIPADESITVQYIPGTLRTTAGVEISAFTIDAVNNSEVPDKITSTGDNEDLRIYPIPFYSQLTIENTGTHSIKSIKIFSTSGRVLFHLSDGFSSNIIQLNLGQLDPGIYFLVIEDQHRAIRVSKIVKN